jgi:hypothetical protein
MADAEKRPAIETIPAGTRDLSLETLQRVFGRGLAGGAGCGRCRSRSHARLAC